jgi:hypothetical protein
MPKDILLNGASPMKLKEATSLLVKPHPNPSPKERELEDFSGSVY